MDNMVVFIFNDGELGGVIVDSGIVGRVVCNLCNIDFICIFAVEM